MATVLKGLESGQLCDGVLNVVSEGALAAKVESLNESPAT